MRAIFMKYKSRIKKRNSKNSVLIENSNNNYESLIHLNPINTFSSTPCYSKDTAIAYSKGKLSNCLKMPWD